MNEECWDGVKGKGNVMDRIGSVGLANRNVNDKLLKQEGFFNAKMATTSRVKGR